MDDKAQSGLQHISTGAALSLHSTRSGIIARGRRDAANAASNPHYKQAVADYNSGNVTAAAAGFQLAAEQGHAYAQANLSFRYYAADDFDESFAWCQRAAYSNLPWAQFNLGLMYRKGEGTAQSDTDAAYWYRLAATQNFAEAQQKLADLYYLGQGVPRSYDKAAEWYRRAAEQGNAEAQFQLAHLYATGQGIEPDYTQSRHWIRKAAQQGHEQAQRELKRREYRDP